MGLIRSELHCLGITIQKKIAFLGREQSIHGLTNQSLKNCRSKIFTPCHLYQSDHLFYYCFIYYCVSIYFIYLFDHLFNFVVVAVFIKCSNSKKYH